MSTEISELLTVTEAAQVLRISRNLTYELVHQGRLPHLQLGRRILVPRRALDLWIVEEAHARSSHSES